MDQLAAMRAFVRIAEAGSFSRAAASLDMPKPTVTKLIQSLEAHLRTKLLNRTTRRLIITADGAAYYERAVRLLADLEELDTSLAVSQVRPKGRLRIDVSAAVAQLIIIPALGGFAAEFPDIQIEIGASDRVADLIAENIDCVIRAGELRDPSFIARRIGEMHLVTCAAPSYLARHEPPSHPSELEQGGHTVVNFFGASSGRILPFAFARGEEALEIRGRHFAAVNEATSYLAAGLAGHGILQVPRFMAAPALTDGRLRRVLTDWTVPSIPLYVVYPPNRHLSNKLRVFVDWVANLFAAPEFRHPSWPDADARFSASAESAHQII